MEALQSEFNYFEGILHQSTVLDEGEKTVVPTAAPVPDQPIEFLLPGADAMYYDLNESLFHFDVKIVKEDGTALADANAVGPVNNLFHSMWANIEVYIQGKMIGENTNMYHYKAYLGTLLNYSEDVLKTRGRLEGWVKDTAGKLNITDIAGANEGLKTRAAAHAKSAVVTLIGRPQLDIFHQDKPIPQRCDVRIRFIPNKADVYLMTAAPKLNEAQVKYKLEVVKAQWNVHYKVMSNSLMLALEKMAIETPFRLPKTKVQMKHLSLAKGVTHVLHDNLYSGQIPDRVIIGLVASDDFSGGYQSNCFNFQHFGVNSIALNVNGKLYPREAIRPDYAAGYYKSAYMELLRGLGLHTSDRMITLMPEDFANGYTLYCFKLTPGPVDTRVRAYPKAGSVRLELQFAEATTKNITVVLCSEQPSTLMIDRYRNATEEL